MWSSIRCGSQWKRQCFYVLAWQSTSSFSGGNLVIQNPPEFCLHPGKLTLRGTKAEWELHKVRCSKTIYAVLPTMLDLLVSQDVNHRQAKDVTRQYRIRKKGRLWSKRRLSLCGSVMEKQLVPPSKLLHLYDWLVYRTAWHWSWWRLSWGFVQ